MYAMGIYDMPMMLTHNTGYYASHGYDQAVVDYFEHYPPPLLVLWGTNLVTGFLSPLVLVFSARIAKNLALTSVLTDTILLLFTFAFRNRLTVLGMAVGYAKRHFYTKWIPCSEYESLNMEYELYTEKSVAKKPEIDLLFAIKRKDI